MNVQKMAKSGSLGMKKAGEKDNLDILSRTLSGRRGTFFVLHFKIIQSYFRIKRYGLISTPSISAPIGLKWDFNQASEWVNDVLWKQIESMSTNHFMVKWPNM